MIYDPAMVGIALINSDAALVVKDRRTLTGMGYGSIRLFPTLVEARPHLADDAVGLILLGDRIGALSGMECLRAIKRDKTLQHKAVVMLSSEGRRERVLEAVSAGCCGYVLRPYSPETCARHLRSAWESTPPDEDRQRQMDRAGELAASGQLAQAAAAYAAVASTGNDALDLFNKGLEHLRLQEFGPAIQAFNMALAVNTMFADAYRGLAHAHKGLGDQAKFLEYLNRCADILAIQDKLQELKEVFVEILEQDPGAVNPYNTLGVRLRRSGDLSGALHAYTQALALTPGDENLHYNIAKAFLHASRREKAMEHLRQALVIRPDFSEAEQMLAELENPTQDGTG